MEDPIRVEVVCRGYDLKHESLDFGRKKRLYHVFKESLQVVFDEIHNEVYAVRRGKKKWLTTSGIGAFQGDRCARSADLLLERSAHDHLTKMDDAGVA